MNPLVSVIMACYNQGRYLGQAIDSVLAQTYPSVELLVIDNASTDETPNVARAYGSRIRYIRLLTRGISLARNAGLDAMTGAYWAIFDSDNMYEPDFLREMVAFIESGRTAPLDFVYCQRWLFSDNQTKVTRTHAPEFDAALFKRRNFIDPNTCLMRTSSCKGVRFDKTLEGWEDYDFLMSLIKRGAQCALLDKPLVRYRLHSASMTATVQRGLTQPALLRRLLKKHRDFYTADDIRAAKKSVANSVVLTLIARRSAQAGWRQRWADVLNMARFASNPSQVLDQIAYAAKLRRESSKS